MGQGLRTLGPWGQLAGLWGLYFCFGLGFSSLPPLVAVVQRDLQMTPTQMGQILGSWQFVYMFCAIPAAWVMVRRGVSLALGVSAVLILVSLVLRVFATDHLGMLLAVALLGVAGPVVSIGCPFLVGQIFEGKSFGFAMGLYATAPVLANMLTFSLTGPVLLPVFQDDWRMVLALWACCGALFGGLWALLPATAELNSERAAPALLSALGRLGHGFLVRICLVGVLVFFVDHGFKSWLPEILRTAGYKLADVALWSTMSIGMWLVALLIVPGQITGRQSYRRALLYVCALLVTGTIGVVMSQPGPIFIAACLAMGFAIGPLMTLCLMPIVTQPGITGAVKITVMALFFTMAEIGGTLGPVLLGASYDIYGGFNLALWGFVPVALAIALLLLRPVNLYQAASAKENMNA